MNHKNVNGALPIYIIKIHTMFCLLDVFLTNTVGTAGVSASYRIAGKVHRRPPLLQYAIA